MISRCPPWSIYPTWLIDKYMIYIIYAFPQQIDIIGCTKWFQVVAIVIVIVVVVVVVVRGPNEVHRAQSTISIASPQPSQLDPDKLFTRAERIFRKYAMADPHRKKSLEGNQFQSERRSSTTFTREYNLFSYVLWTICVCVCILLNGGNIECSNTSYSIMEKHLAVWFDLFTDEKKSLSYPYPWLQISCTSCFLAEKSIQFFAKFISVGGAVFVAARAVCLTWPSLQKLDLSIAPERISPKNSAIDLFKDWNFRRIVSNFSINSGNVAQII